MIKHKYWKIENGTMLYLIFNIEKLSWKNGNKEKEAGGISKSKSIVIAFSEDFICPRFDR